jgi:hypothetical protein
MSHMNRSILDKCQFRTTDTSLPQIEKTVVWNKKSIITMKSKNTRKCIHFYYILSSASSSISTIPCDTKSWQVIWEDLDQSSWHSLKCCTSNFQASSKTTSTKLMSLQVKGKDKYLLNTSNLPRCDSKVYQTQSVYLISSDFIPLRPFMNISAN